jgi:hypothetical protein
MLLNICLAPNSFVIQSSNNLFMNSLPRSNCQVFNGLLFLAVIIFNVSLHASNTFAAVFVFNSVTMTSSEISSTTVSTYLNPFESCLLTTARSERRCSPIFPLGCLSTVLPWFSALCLYSRHGLHNSMNLPE